MNKRKSRTRASRTRSRKRASRTRSRSKSKSIYVVKFKCPEWLTMLPPRDILGFRTLGGAEQMSLSLSISLKIENLFIEI